MVPLASHFESSARLHLLLFISVDLVALVDAVSLAGVVCPLAKDEKRIVVVVSGSIWCLDALRVAQSSVLRGVPLCDGSAGGGSRRVLQLVCKSCRGQRSHR